MNVLLLSILFLVTFLAPDTVILSSGGSNCCFSHSSLSTSYAQQEQEFNKRENEVLMPTIRDPSLRVELVTKGLKMPTTMAFLGHNDLLVLEKNTGKVYRVTNGKIMLEPLLDVNVATSVERGTCGIAISKTTPGHVYVFLYYTEADTEDGEDRRDGKAPLGNRVYRYELIGNKLVNPKLFLDLPADPGPRHNANTVAPGRHNGGMMTIGPDNNLYIAVGDIDKSTNAQNIIDGPPPDGSSSILRITQDGQKTDNILGNKRPLDLYFAYGIRNSFGLDFDPLTGNLWNTENGPYYGDEMNLVEPGFNSGWLKVQGMASTGFNVNNLVNFQGKGIYSDPEFVWNHTIGPTAIKFIASDRLGSQYKNDIFVSDITQGNIYHFDLTSDRTKLVLDGLLADKISNNSTENQDIIFGEGFGGVSDLKVGPYDGFLYVLSYVHGAVYRIVS